jgi:putative ABC transport system ATP-binding protein
VPHLDAARAHPPTDGPVTAVPVGRAGAGDPDCGVTVPGGGPPPLFAFDDVHLTVDGQEVLRGASGAVPDGGITVVSGPSGSGKSTLLRLCNRLEVPSAGTVRFRGDDVADLEPVSLRRRVGMVFQRPTPFPGTGLANLRVADPAITDTEAADLLDRVGLDGDFLERDASGLSGGEAQRLCLARTMATGCEVLLADECTSALDPDATTVLEELARRLAAEGTPIVWVTHDPAQRERLSDHRLVVEHGRIVVDEPAADGGGGR